MYSDGGSHISDGLCSSTEYGAMPDWDVSKVTNMSNMFENANAFTQDLSDWDTSSLTRLYRIFYTSNANPKVANWDVSRVTSMSEVFSHAYSFNQDISSWDVSSVTTMYELFYNAGKYNQDLESWNTTLVTSMYHMFASTNSFNGKIGSWDVSHVTNMEWMFYNAKAFNQPVGKWDVSRVQHMNYMFWSATVFDQNLATWPETSVTSNNVALFVYQAPAFELKYSCPNSYNGPPIKCVCKEGGCLDNTNFKASIEACLAESPEDGKCFSYGTITTDFGIMEDWDTSSVIDMSFAFGANCDNFATDCNRSYSAIFNADISRWNTSSVKNYAWHVLQRYRL